MGFLDGQQNSFWGRRRFFLVGRQGRKKTRQDKKENARTKSKTCDCR
eukprot:COSAG06_NODE_505_length_14944_cov_17.290901_6_plen_47_part_00